MDSLTFGSDSNSDLASFFQPLWIGLKRFFDINTLVSYIISYLYVNCKLFYLFRRDIKLLRLHLLLYHAREDTEDFIAL